MEKGGEGENIPPPSGSSSCEEVAGPAAEGEEEVGEKLALWEVSLDH